MRAFLLFTRLLGVAFIIVAALHFVLGLQADALLGVTVLPETASNPSLESQNRFYGTTFSLLGVVLFICTTDLRRYAPMLNAVLGVLFLAGIGRIISWGIYGAPAPSLIVIACADIFIPPVQYFWFKRVLV